MWGSGRSDRWVVGSNHRPPSPQGTLGHYSGESWTPEPLAALAEPVADQPLYALWGSGPDDIWVGGGKDKTVLLHYDTDWSVVPLPTKPAGPIVALWGSGRGDLWAAIPASSGNPGATLLHRKGAGWTVMSADPMSSVRAIWGSGPDDVWFGGVGPDNSRTFIGGVLHYDGSSLTPQNLNLEVDSLSGSSADDVWLTAGLTQMLGDVFHPHIFDQEFVMHYDGKAWMKVPGPQLLHRRGASIKSFGHGDVWLLHDHLDHLEGDSWVTYQTMKPSLLRLWGTDPRHLWFFGADTILRYLP